MFPQARRRDCYLLSLVRAFKTGRSTACSAGDGRDVIGRKGGDDSNSGEADGDVLVGDGHGLDLVVGFKSGEDVLDFSLVEVVASCDDLVLVDIGPAVLISYGSGFLLLSNTSLGSVEEADFVLA